MSWPADGKPRFVIGTVTGMAKSGIGSNTAFPGTSWLVLDRANLHALVAEYRSEEKVPGEIHAKRERRREYAEQSARRHAEQLNADHEAAGAVADHAIQVTVSENAERFGNWAKGWNGDPKQTTAYHDNYPSDTTSP